MCIFPSFFLLFLFLNALLFTHSFGRLRSWERMKKKYEMFTFGWFEMQTQTRSLYVFTLNCQFYLQRDERELKKAEFPGAFFIGQITETESIGQKFNIMHISKRRVWVCFAFFLISNFNFPPRRFRLHFGHLLNIGIFGLPGVVHLTRSALEYTCHRLNSFGMYSVWLSWCAFSGNCVWKIAARCQKRERERNLSKSENKIVGTWKALTKND